MGWTDRTSSASDIRDYVALYESSDYVSRLYHSYHGTSADTAKVREINAAFLQGRTYFDNAQSASIAVKPVLLYYGVLSFCVGLVLCKDHHRREESVPPSHGLTRVRWPATLKTGIANVLDLKIRTQPTGWFRELTRVTWNRVVSSMFQGELQNRDTFPYVHELGQVSVPAEQSPVTLGDLISRSKYCGSAFGQVTGRRRIHRATLRLDYKRGIILSFPLSVGQIPGWFNGLSEQDGISTAKGERGLVFRRNDPRLPVFDYHGSHFMSVIEDFPGGYQLNEFIKLVLISYALGMLARYFPSKWMALIHNDEQTSARPLLAKSTKVVENEFVREFAQQLAVFGDDAPFFGDHFGELSAMLGPDWRTVHF